MLKTRHEVTEKVSVTIDGQQMDVPQGISVAAAVLSVRDGPTRSTPVSGDGRAPYCMMGVCFECLMDIDGIPNRQACMVMVADGMVINPQEGASRLGDSA